MLTLDTHLHLLQQWPRLPWPKLLNRRTGITSKPVERLPTLVAFYIMKRDRTQRNILYYHLRDIYWQWWTVLTWINTPGISIDFSVQTVLSKYQLSQLNCLSRSHDNVMKALILCFTGFHSQDDVPSKRPTLNSRVIMFYKSVVLFSLQATFCFYI